MNPRPVIAPGLHVLDEPAALAAGYLQVGMTPSHRLRVRDTPAVRRALSAIGRGEIVDSSTEHQRALDLLRPALRDGDALQRAGVCASDSAAAALRSPDTFSARLLARTSTRLEVRGSLGVAVSPLLEAVGLGAPIGDESQPGRALVLALSPGEPRREQFDLLTRAGTPHLLVRAIEGEILIGPFVLPGVTACVRCLDLHRGDAEPGYGSLLRRLVRARRHDGVDEPLDTAVAWVALGLAAQDLVRYVEGDRPHTWSSTILLRTGCEVPPAASWTPHPDCSCTWASPAATPDQI